jgi:hypothetical protein
VVFDLDADLVGQLLDPDFERHGGMLDTVRSQLRDDEYH